MSLDKRIESDVKPWIDFLDSMRVLGVSDNLPIPQIAVFGDQSSGKSSLLEALSGIPFPRGTGLVTRCATCISLHQSEESSWSAKIRITSKNPKYNVPELETTSKEELTSKIAELTDLLTDNDQSKLSKDGILIRVTAPNISNITIVDLPGIVRTTTSGQSKTVIAEIDALLKRIMNDPKTIILAVIPANQDIATIDVLERAQAADPSGTRTIGVLTKADLVDQGGEQEVLSVLKNVRKPLALGYVIVKNRSQAQLKMGLSAEDAAANEEDFFTSHPVWHSLKKESRGIAALTVKLTTVLVSRVKEALPSIVSQIQVKLLDVEKEMHELGPEVASSDAEKRKTLLRLISRYCQVLRQIAEGDYRDILPQKMPILRVKYLATEIIHELKTQLNSRIPNFDSDSFAEKLEKCLVNMRGRELPGFLSAKLLLSTISSDLLYWRQDVDLVVLRIIETFTRAAEILSGEMTSQFPRVNEALLGIIGECCNSQLIEINRRVEEIFARGAEGAVNDTELTTCINQIRFNRFENAIRNVLEQYNDRVAHSTGSAPPPPPSQQQQQQGGRQHSTASTTSYNSTTNTLTRNPPATGGGGGSLATSSATHAAAIAAASTLDDAREYTRRVLGHYYMDMHGVGEGQEGFNVHVEDARMVLKAFWVMSENRLHSDIESTVDQMILQKISEKVEQELLSQLQIWSSKGSVLGAMLSEDPAVNRRRKELAASRVQYNEALKKIHEISPVTIANMASSPSAAGPSAATNSPTRQY